MSERTGGAAARSAWRDGLAIAAGVVLGELHRLFLAPLLAAAAMVSTIGRNVKTHVATFLAFDLVFQWVGLALVFVVVVAMSRVGSARVAHWLAAVSLALGIGVRLAAGQYVRGGYPLWYEIAIPLGTVFAWAVALCYASFALREQAARS